jgi:hypothetical protein
MRMIRNRTSPVLLFVVVLGFAISIAARENEPSPWLEIHSTHFTVITDAGDKKGKEIALRFEQMRSVFASLLLKDRLNQPVPLTILAFKNDKNYFQCAPLRDGQPIAAPGFFVHGEDQNFIVLNLFEEESWRAVAHDFAHMLLNYNYPPVEGWFDEGMAEYFSSIRVANKEVEIGGDPELQPLYSQDLLQNQHQAQDLPKSLTELLGGQVWLAWPDLLTMKHDTSAYNEATHHTLFYAQSWITVHYLINKKKLPETGTFFDLIENQHMPVDKAVLQAYDKSLAQFDESVKDYFHSLTPLFLALDTSKLPNAAKNQAQPYVFPAPVGAEDSAILAKPMRVADANAVTAEMEMRIPERREAALKELQTLATTPDPATQAKFDEKKNKKSEEEGGALIAVMGNEIAHRALAWDHLQHGEFDAAAEELGDAAALNQGDMWIRFYLSVLKYRMASAKHTDIQGLPNMMQDLRAVLDWHPEFADAYDMLAVARMAGGGSIAAMQSERAAMQLSPRNQEYVYHLALIYVDAKKWDAARALLDRLKTSSNAVVATEAKDQLSKLSNEQKYGLSAVSPTGGPKIAPQSSPFDVLDQEAAKRAANESAAQTAANVDKRPPKFVQGRLVGVDCSQAPAAVLTVVSGGTILKLRTSDYKSLLLIGADTFSCTWNNRAVSVNYKPGGLSDGDLVSVEVR